MLQKIDDSLKSQSFVFLANVLVDQAHLLMKPKEHATHPQNVLVKVGQQMGTVPQALVCAAPFLCHHVDQPFQKTAPT